MTRLKTASKPVPAITSWHTLVTAMAQSGTWLEGFQMSVSPHTEATRAFHDHTATGKLKAVMTPTGPSGCHCSIMRCSGRSEAIVKP